MDQEIPHHQQARLDPPENLVKHYQHGQLTIHWQPAKCTHSTLCWRGLPHVFNPRARPWIHADGAEADRIMAQIDKCPSGALSYTWADTTAEADKIG